MIQEQRREEIYRLALDVGYDEAARQKGISRETVRRYVRFHKEGNEPTEVVDEKLVRQLKDRFTDDELRRILKSSESGSAQGGIRHDFAGEDVTFGFITDTHLGSKYTDIDRLYSAFDEFAKQDVDFIVHAGDVHEGLSHRPGHYYECSHIGFSAQLQHSREVFSQWSQTPIYMIDGNHDRWYIKSNGAIICEELARSQDNLHFIGHDEGDIDINGAVIKLWHGEDGSSYAFSYRIQKIIESLTGGEKPSVFLCGHTHKSIYIFDRNVHCVSGGAMQSQSKWMRGKRAASHVGFWVVNMTIDNGEIVKFSPSFYPFYR